MWRAKAVEASQSPPLPAEWARGSTEPRTGTYIRPLAAEVAHFASSHHIRFGQVLEGISCIVRKVAARALDTGVKQLCSDAR